jgi:hypothetical protein
MRTKRIAGMISLVLLAASAFVVPCLGLLVPPAGVGCFIASTYFGAVAVACGAAGPAGWAIFGMCTTWAL